MPKKRIIAGVYVDILFTAYKSARVEAMPIAREVYQFAISEPSQFTKLFAFDRHYLRNLLAKAAGTQLAIRFHNHNIASTRKHREREMKRKTHRELTRQIVCLR